MSQPRASLGRLRRRWLDRTTVTSAPVTNGNAVQGNAPAPHSDSASPPVNEPPAMPALYTVVCNDVATSACWGPEALTRAV